MGGRNFGVKFIASVAARSLKKGGETKPWEALCGLNVDSDEAGDEEGKYDACEKYGKHIAKI